MVISQPSYLYKRNAYTAKILQNMNQNFKIHTKVLCLIYQTRLFFWFLAFIHVFTRGQFWPSGIVIACVCVCVYVCINHELVRTITYHLFKLGSPNLDHICKTPWLTSLLFLGPIDLELQGQI